MAARAQGSGSEDLMSRASATRRMVLVAYATHNPTYAQAVTHCLKQPMWAPTTDDSPVPWEVLEAWYQGLQRTGQLVMDSY
jgi:hypothetical protein